MYRAGIVPVLDSLQRARARYRSHAALGADLGLTGEEVGRALKGKRGVSAEVAVRLAILNGEVHPAALDAAGYHTFAALLRGIYEPAGQKRLMRKQRAILELLESIDSSDLEHLLALAKRLVGRRQTCLLLPQIPFDPRLPMRQEPVDFA